MYGEAITRAIVNFIIVCIVAAFALGVAVAYGLPWLWSILKPLIHGWTA